LAWAAGAGAARADVFHLKGGDKIEGEVVEDLGEAYRVRTLMGVVDIEKERIVEREEGPSPWRLYKEKRRRCSDTAEGHYRMAQWCRKHGLRAEEKEHLERAIGLDPDHEAARQALGYVRETSKSQNVKTSKRQNAKRGGQGHGPGVRWVKPRSPQAPTEAEKEARRAAREEERLLRKLITEWFVKIKAIYRGRMAKQKGGMQSEKFRKARAQLLAIRDPLALPAMTGVLSTGSVAARRVLVEMLSEFDEDEATMNLVVMTLLDPSAEIRRLAAIELIGRRDDRVVTHLRGALGSEAEHVLRNAAVALGVLKAREAVGDLVSVLSIKTRRTVRVSQPVYLDSIRATFGGGYRHLYRDRLLYYRPGAIGVLGPGSMVGTATRYERRTVLVHRTEVQEALIAITGQNFGFDAAAWLQWWRQNDE
jgi:hypothetical protein